MKRVVSIFVVIFITSPKLSVELEVVVFWKKLSIKEVKMCCSECRKILIEMFQGHSQLFDHFCFR